MNTSPLSNQFGPRLQKLDREIQDSLSEVRRHIQELEQAGQQADPRPVTEPSTIVGALGSESLALNGMNGCALMPNRQVHCWGTGYSHEANPVPDINAVTSLTKFGEDGFCVSRVDFSVYCWTPGGNPTLNTGW